MFARGGGLLELLLLVILLSVCFITFESFQTGNNPPSTSSRFAHGNIKSFCMKHVYEKTSLPPKSVLCEFESPTSSLAQRGAVLIKKNQKSLHRSTNFSIKIRETPLDLTSKAKFKLTILCIIYRMCQNVFTN